MPESSEPPFPPPTDSGSQPPYGSGYDGIGFMGIGGDLLKTFPSLSPPVEPPKLDVPNVPAVYGSQLVSPMQAGATGARATQCPVCVSKAVVPQLAGGWVPLRCDSCGTEFVASDGSPPPPLPVAKPATPAPVRTAVAGSRILSLILLGDGGVRLARCPTCHTLETVRTAGNRVEMRCGSCGTEYVAASSLAPPTPLPPPALPRPATPAPARPAARSPAPSGIPSTDAVRTSTDGTRSVMCPVCRRFSVSLPRVLPTFTITVTCPGCRSPFTVNLRRAMKKPGDVSKATRLKRNPGPKGILLLIPWFILIVLLSAGAVIAVTELIQMWFFGG
ncbi:MAG: hypothetical protein C0467_25065 [Planctomycetaceae bacterium]|nr:hypothetical protein [Planctomycetaceae bacterium]